MISQLLEESVNIDQHDPSAELTKKMVLRAEGELMRSEAEALETLLCKRAMDGSALPLTDVLLQDGCLQSAMASVATTTSAGAPYLR